MISAVSADKRIRRIERQDAMKRRLRFYGLFFLAYTAIWVVVAVIIFMIFRDNNRTFFWNLDGIYQHFSSFKYLNDFVKALFGGNVSAVAPINYSIGYGTDILTALDSYDFTDPISWLCVLLPISMTRRYALMMFIKLWLTGAAFSVFCFAAERFDRKAVMCGALSYTFSGAIIMMFVRHPNFINWGYLLPLMLAGVELYRRRRNPYLLIAAVCINLIISFYTFFINAIILTLYVVIFSICEIARDKSSETFKKVLFHDLKLLAFCVIGVLLSMAILLPTLYAFSQNPRAADLTGYSESMFRYPDKFYCELFVSLFMPYKAADYTSNLGFIPMILIAVPALFMKRRRNTPLKVMLIVLTVFLCVPICGRLMNGMGYASNRWAFAMVFFCSLALTEVLPLLGEFSENMHRVLVLIGAGYITVCVLLTNVMTGELKRATMVLLAFTLAVYLISSKISPRIFKGALAFLVIVGVLFSAVYTFDPMGANFVKQFNKDRKLSSFFADSSRALSGESNADDFWRVESAEINTNIDGYNKVYSTDAWWSVLPKTYLDFFNSFELNDVAQNCNFKGVDGRSSLLTLSSVKYYTAEAGSTSAIPYGFERSQTYSTDKYDVFENQYALPVAYTYSEYMTREYFDSLTAVRRQQALLEAAVLDEPVDSLSEAQPKPKVKKLSYTISERSGVTVKKGKITSAGEGSTVTLDVKVPKNCEVYLRLGGIEVTDPSYVKLVVRRENTKGYHVEKSGIITNSGNNWPVIRDGVTFNLGVGGSGKNRVQIEFRQESKYTYDSIELLAVPMDGYEEQVQALAEEPFRNAHVDGNSISGDITVKATRLLHFSVPYSIGYTAYIDSKPVELLHSNGMFMAVVVPPGTHSVELRYETPYLREGVMISAVSLLGVIVFAIIRSAVRKRKKKES